MAIHIRRREFISLLSSTAATWPLGARAQQSAKLPITGFYSLGSAAAMNNWVAAFVQRLRELGWIEGRTVAIEYRWAEGRSERLAEIAAEFVRLKVDVIVTHSAAPVVAAKRATSVIPIVFAIAADPVGTGLVESLALPGRNVTGLSVQTTDLAAKRLELLRQVVPSLRRVAILANAGNPAAELEVREVQTAARTLGLEAATHEHADAAHLFVLLRARRNRPRRRTAKRDDEFSSLDMDCHATLPWGSCPCNRGTISRFDCAVCGYFHARRGSPETNSDAGISRPQHLSERN
jgi:putative tryptophan/tyrosine transport system substrate-binding protein